MNVQLIVLDVDGVMSDGHIAYSSSGEEWKSFYAQDGLGLSIARNLGIKLAIITGRTSSIVQRRGEELGFSHIIMGCSNKTEALLSICKEENISLRDVAYMGDDLNDLAVMSAVGVPVAPANACLEIKKIAGFVSSRSGGHGAVREAIEYIVKGMGLWDKALQAFASESYQNKQ